MPRKIPSNLPPEVRRALVPVWEALEAIEAKNASLSARRFEHAGSAKAPEEYITKAQLDKRIRHLRLPGVVGPRRRGGSAAPSLSVLPPATHPMDFGYFYPDGKFGDYYDEIKDYTNLHYVWAWYGYATSETPRSEWLLAMRSSALRAHNDGKIIYFNIGLDAEEQIGDVREVLEYMTEAWDSVKYVCLADEPENFGWNGADEVDERMERLWEDMEAVGLSVNDKWFGCIFTRNAILTGNWVDAVHLDYVAIEAYVTAPGGTAQQNEAQLVNDLNAMSARISGDKMLEVIPQAYDRNGFWTNIDTLTALQTVPYLWSYDKERVMLLTPFNYGREGIDSSGNLNGGTHLHPELKEPHQRIWAAIQSGVVGATALPNSGNSVMAFKAYHEHVEQAINTAITSSSVSKTGVVLTSYSDGATLRGLVVTALNQMRDITARADPSSPHNIEIRGTGNRKFQETYTIFDSGLRAKARYRHTTVPIKF